MIIRIVKMTFRPNAVEEFKSLFSQHRQAIRAFNGVQRLDLYQDKQHSNIFFTYSIWNSPSDLKSYRNSSLFKEVWSKTRILFEQKAEAWSLDQLITS